jgi:hypothetical protein
MTAVDEFDNLDGEHVVLNGINNAIISLPNTITLLTGKLFTTRRSRIFFKKINSFDDALQVLLGNRVKVPYDGSFKIDLIFGHCV